MRPLAGVLPVVRVALVCSGCGYGIVRAAPPERCPMCQEDHGWLHADPRPLARAVSSP